MNPTTLVIIPAFNEAQSIGKVIKDIPSFVKEIVVVNNNSTDATAAIAEQAGATVLHESNQGYGNACLRGIDYATTKQPDIIAFIDGDYSDYPEELEKIVQPIIQKEADIVIGSRTLGNRQKGAMTPQQIIGNKLAAFLLGLLYGVKVTDLGPFRAIGYPQLMALEMRDKTYGWTVEMQLKAAKQHLRMIEVPVTYRKRIGVSKISGTLKGTISAGYKILFTIFRYL